MGAPRSVSAGSSESAASCAGPGQSHTAPRLRGLLQAEAATVRPEAPLRDEPTNRRAEALANPRWPAPPGCATLPSAKILPGTSAGPGEGAPAAAVSPP